VSQATPLLRRLLRRGEAARLRGDAKPASLPLSGASAREYLALATLQARESFHSQIALAERAGAISVVRDRHRGDGEQLLRIGVADLEKLALHLGVDLLASRIGNAAATLDAWRTRLPVLERVLDAWRLGRKVRGHGPEAATELADAARAVLACQEAGARERVLRRESVRLFGDSKRLETLTTWLDLLSTGELVADGPLERSHVWAALGLRREPLPLLLAGPGELQVGHDRIPLVRPWLGIAPESLQALDSPARTVLSIENLASFHEAARLPCADARLLLYTGGMPSPAWREAYARILACLREDAGIYHWGDIDEGGFRIAAVLAATAAESGRRLRPWCMSPAALPDDILASVQKPDRATLATMQRWARRAGWDEVADDLETRPLRLEQEALDLAGSGPALPGSGAPG